MAHGHYLNHSVLVSLLWRATCSPPPPQGGKHRALGLIQKGIASAVDNTQLNHITRAIKVGAQANFKQSHTVAIYSLGNVFFVNLQPL